MLVVTVAGSGRKGGREGLRRILWGFGLWERACSYNKKASISRDRLSVLVFFFFFEAAKKVKEMDLERVLFFQRLPLKALALSPSLSFSSGYDVVILSCHAKGI